MKKLTTMKNKNVKYRNPVIALLIITLFIAGCFSFEFVNQPYTANPNSFFSVETSVSIYGGEQRGSGIPYFGVLMPVGWIADDSIQYIKVDYPDSGYVYFSDSLSQRMNAIDPPPENYYWWVATSENSVNDGTYNVNFNIYTDDQTGNFFLDYMVGSKGEGLNYNRSNDHLIIIGEVEGCAPEEVVFSSQEEIDNFQSNYPGCTVMAGDITISGNNITNFNGLCVLTKIGGSLRIVDNAALTYLTGLENLESIGCNLTISGNASLINIQGIDNLKSLERNLIIENNPALTQIGGLNSLSTIGRSFSIVENDNLLGIVGIKDLTSIGRDFSIKNNNALDNLAGLEALNSIGGNLVITENNALASLTNLENLSSIGGNLTITLNPLLSNCEAEGICTYLSSPTGYFAIRDNAPGCSSIIELAVACGTTLPCLEEQNYVLSSQFDVDHFPVVFPGCTDILTSISIYGDDIVNLDSLDMITSIGGSLSINSNYALTSLAGLENVTAIGGGLSISGNDALTSLTSLENLSYIGGSLSIGSNGVLTSLVGLENVNSIGGDLSIEGNAALTSLSGLENLNNIGGELSISSNNSLTNLEGLNGLNYVTATLYIGSNNAMTSLTGIENLSYVGGEYFAVYDNPVLTSLKGFDSLTTIKNDLFIGGNPHIKSLEGLENLDTIGRNLLIGIYPDYGVIVGNDALLSLEGIDSLKTIGGGIYIAHNKHLINCAIQPVCEYLANPNGTTEIHDNGTGCDSEVEVQHACWIITIDDENVLQNQFTFYPNPVTANAKLSGEFASSGVVNICLYNTTGICLKSWEFKNQQTGQQESTLDLSNLPPGIYFLRLQAGNEVVVKKVVKL